MPAIWLFSRQKETPKAEELIAFAEEEVGVTTSAFPQAAEDEDDRDMTLFSVIEDGEETGSARVYFVPREEREAESQELIDDLLSQAEDLSDEMNGNKWDILIAFDATEEDLLAGCVVAYAVGSLCGCGLLVTGLEELDGEDEEHEHEHEHDESCSCSKYYANAEDFADEFFGEDEEEGADLEDDDDEDDDLEDDDEEK